MRYFVVCSVAVGLLAGCGGGGGGGGGGGSNVPSLKSYLDEVDRLDAKYTSSDATPRASLPKGSARYDGVGGILTRQGTVDEDAVLGRARIDADFDTNQVSARVDGFRDPDGDRVSGTVKMDDGTLFDNGVLFGTVDGDLDGGRVDGDAQGAFFGKRGQAAQIALDGVVKGGGSAGAFEGFISGER